ncbi:MAG: hypothetical protein OHK0056_22290 [Bacteriovoracaceae bacterium]
MCNIVKVIFKFLFLTFSLPLMLRAEPTCSVKGDKIYYLNGVNNSHTEATDSLNIIKSIFKDQPSDARRISKKDLNDQSFELLYNVTLGINDFAEVLALKLEEAGESDPWEKTSKIFFKTSSPIADISKELFTWDEFNVLENQLNIVNEAIFETRYSYVLIDLEKQLGTTISLSAKNIENDLSEGYKAIVVSHSQGNLIANKIYGDLFEENTVSDEFAQKYKPYFSNLQIASAASSIKTDPQNQDYITLESDNVIKALDQVGKLLGLETLDPNYSIIEGFYLTGDIFSILSDVYENYSGHGFTEIYTNPSILARQIGNPTMIPKSMRDLFIDKLESAVSKMPPNCCINSNNEVVAETLVPFGGGYVSTEITSVPGTLELSRGATICSGVTGLNNVKLEGNVYVSGNTEINNCNVNSFNGLVNIVGLGSQGVRINGSESNNRDLLFSNDAGTSLTIIGDSISISGHGNIGSEGTLNSIGDNSNIELVYNNEFGVSWLSMKNSRIERSQIVLANANNVHYPKKIENCTIENSTIVTDQDTFECLGNSTVADSILFDVSLSNSNVTRSSLSMPNGEMISSLLLRDANLSPSSLGVGVQVLGPSVDIFRGHVGNNVLVASNGELGESDVLGVFDSTIRDGGKILGRSLASESTIGSQSIIQNSMIYISKIEDAINVTDSLIQGVPSIAFNKIDNRCDFSNYNQDPTREEAGEIYYNKCFNRIQWLIDNNIEERLWY